MARLRKEVNWPTIPRRARGILGDDPRKLTYYRCHCRTGFAIDPLLPSQTFTNPVLLLPQLLQKLYATLRSPRCAALMSVIVR